MTDFRALCAELAEQLDDALDFTVSGETKRHMKLLTRRARAALAEPQGEGPTDGELNAICDGTPWHGSPRQFGREVARTVLARWGRPAPPPALQPVSVAERLPGAEDCDAEGFCWWFSPADSTAGAFGVAACWVLRKHEPEDDFRTHWLPAHALPLPREVQP